MRIAIITQGISQIVRPLVDSEHEVVAIAESEPRYGGRITHRQFRRHARAVLSAFLPSRVNLEQFSRRNGIPYFWLEKASMETFAFWLRQASPDLLVVFSMSQLLPRSVFTIPRLGTINLHPSFLPEYRGPNPEFWQYHDFRPDGGVTVHYIDEGEDTGDIIYQERIPIAPGTRSAEWIKRVIDETGTALLIRAVDDLGADRATRAPQPKRSPTARARLIRADEHGEIIDWNCWPIERIWHVLRGTESWLHAIPPPTRVFAGQFWTICDFVEDAVAPTDKAGTIQRDRQGYYIACRDGRIRISIRFSFKRALRKLLSHVPPPWRR